MNAIFFYSSIINYRMNSQKRYKIVNQYGGRENIGVQNFDIFQNKVVSDKNLQDNITFDELCLRYIDTHNKIIAKFLLEETYPNVGYQPDSDASI